MHFVAVLFVIGFVLVVFVAIPKARRAARRRVAMEKPFPGEWVEILKTNLPPYSKLSDVHRSQLHQYTQVFLSEKTFEGCGGLLITNEIKVTIAAQACMLLLNGNDACYPKLKSVVVYPSTYVAGGKGMFGGKDDHPQARLGESWGLGTVVLSWDSVKRGAYNFDDGRNVTLHEFAHQLDQADGAADGAPALEQRSAYISWARVFSEEFDHLQENTRKGKRSVLDDYGATNPAEFFAVATETFYEKPRQLQKKHPELFGELKKFYKVNPLEWE